MDDLNSTQGIVALAAAGVAVVALLWVIVLAVKLRRLRAAQSAVLGEHGQSDLVAHAERLGDRLRAAARLGGGGASAVSRAASGQAEQRIDGCIAYTSLVRYDATDEMSGQQSSTVALLDERRTGVVVSSILHRDQARVYVKQVRDGDSEHELSPEEQQAIETAMARPRGEAT